MKVMKYAKVESQIFGTMKKKQLQVACALPPAISINKVEINLTKKGVWFQWPKNAHKWNADNYKADPGENAPEWEHRTKETMRRGLLSNLSSFGYKSANDTLVSKEFVSFPAGCGSLANSPYLQEDW